MGKYSKYERAKPARPWDVHPVWRGIGCVLLIITPIMAYAGAKTLVRENIKNQWIQLPADMGGWVDFSPVTRLLPLAQPFFNSLGRIYYLDIMLTIAFLVLGFGILTVFYSLLYGASGHSRYGPLDSPPIRRSPRRRPR